MLIKKHLQTGIDIQDPIGLYVDIDNNLKNMLIDRYTGRCFRQCYIVEILNIVRYSECIINQEGSPDFGTLNVIFEALVIVYHPREILNGCTVISREDIGTIICSAPNTNIILGHNELTSSLQPGQKISVVVYEAEYTINDDKISVSAVPFAPSKTAIAYKYVPEKLPADFNEYIENVTSAINDVLAALEPLKNSKSYEFFKLIVHAYKDEQKTDAGIHTDLLELVSAPPTAECYIGHDPRIFPTHGKIFMSPSVEQIGDNVTVINDVPPVQILSTLLDDYYNIIKTIFEMINIYNTQEALNAHRNLWLAYANYKNK